MLIFAINFNSAMTASQTTPYILMVRPKAFGYNSETAESNAFQSFDNEVDTEEVKRKALAEFDRMVEKLRQHGIQVVVAEDSEEPEKPDAIFPNNWFSTQVGGTLYTFPMQSVTRRAELRPGILDMIGEKFSVNAMFDFSDKAESEKFLEGTGSMILDRIHKICYACLSPRTHEALLRDWCKISGYAPVIFNAVDGDNQAIYHTNVMMGLGEKYTVICLETVTNPSQRRMLIESFRNTDKDINEISIDQMNAFAGNVLEISNLAGQSFLAMSSRAKSALNEDQIKRIERHSKILDFEIPTIERYGGGSVRCMIAELFLDPIKPI